jgi:hypothetical protein
VLLEEFALLAIIQLQFGAPLDDVENVWVRRVFALAGKGITNLP